MSGSAGCSGMPPAIEPVSAWRFSRVRIAILLALLALSCGLRFGDLDHDLAYEISTYSAALITDEGWYHKSARSLALWGEWGHEMDRNIYSHTPLFTLWMAAVFKVFGVSLETARANSIAAFLVSLWLLYLISRTRWSVEVALAVCLAVSATLHVVTFSRFAIVEPTGVACSLAALVLWIKYPARTEVCVASVALASCAFFLKVSFIFTPIVVAVLWLCDAVDLAARDVGTVTANGAAPAGWSEYCRALRRPRAWARARPLVLAVASTGVATVIALLGVRAWAGRDWFEMQVVAFYEQTDTVGPRDSLIFEIESVLEFLLEEPQRLVLLVAGGLMLPALLLPWTARAARRRVLGRAFSAMALWAVAGFVLLSLFEYRVPRYYYFLIYPMAFLALEGVAAFFTERGTAIAVAGMLGLHLAVQVPAWGSWLDREPSASQADMARAVVASVTSGDEPPVIVGVNAAFVALFDRRVRPLEIEFVEPEMLCPRIDWWRPPYFLHYESELPEVGELCPGIVRELLPIHYYTVMGRWYFDSDVVLARMIYDRPGESRDVRATVSEAR